MVLAILLYTKHKQEINWEVLFLLKIFVCLSIDVIHSALQTTNTIYSMHCRYNAKAFKTIRHEANQGVEGHIYLFGNNH